MSSSQQQGSNNISDSYDDDSTMVSQAEDVHDVEEELSEITELLANAPTLLLEAILVTKKIFRNHYNRDIRGEAPQEQDASHEDFMNKNDFLKRYVNCVSICSAPVEKYFILTEMPSFLESALDAYKNGGDEQGPGPVDACVFFDYILEIISGVFVPLKNRVGTNTYEEMNDWFRLVNGRMRLAGDAAKKWENAHRDGDARDHNENRTEIMLFNHKSMFLYASHIVYLECVHPKIPNPEIADDFSKNVCKLDWSGKGEIKNTDSWQFMSATQISHLYPDEDYQWDTNEVKIGGYSVEQTRIRNFLVGKKCKTKGTFESGTVDLMHGYYHNLLFILSTDLAQRWCEFSTLYGGLVLHDQVKTSYQTHLHVMMNNLFGKQKKGLVQMAEKQRRSYYRNKGGSTNRDLSNMFQTVNHLDNHLFGFFTAL